MTTRLRSAHISKGFPVNYCSGFRLLSMVSACEVDGLYLFVILSLLCSCCIHFCIYVRVVESILFTWVDWDFSIHSSIIYTETWKFGVAGVSRQNFNLEVNAKDYGFEPTNTPRTDRSVKFLSSFAFSFPFLHGLSSDLTFDEYTFAAAFPIINYVVFYLPICYYVN